MTPLISLYLPRYAVTLVYMLQNTEYQVWPYLQWYWRTQDFSRVERRRSLQRTKAARVLLLVLACGMLLQIALGLLALYYWWRVGWQGGWAFGAAILISYPLVWAHLIVVPLLLGRWLIVKPREALLIRRSRQAFQTHPAVKVAIIGSYGKTSMKELLLTVLGAGKKVAATPANKNVAASHAAFARTLKGDEDILLIEYGEGAPGDIARFARTTHPTHAVITGVAAAHLDHYKSTEDAGQDIFSVARFIDDASRVYVNDESLAARPFIERSFASYNRDEALGWLIGDVKISIDGLSFTLAKDKQTLRLTSGLLGRHNLGPLGLAAALADQFGIDHKTITQAVARTKPYEHRMQPYRLNGAWVIDDTYNGNIEGIRAGTALLGELPAKRKLYATPGLVDQGKESMVIHEEMGRLIARSGASVVVLMQNSVTKYIQAGLDDAGFHGELITEPNPVDFYTNLQHFVAAGDLIMLQNDWPDNYS